MSVKLVRNYFLTSLVVSVVSGTAVTTQANIEIRNQPSTILRLRRAGNQWTVSYSYDAFHWSAAATFAQPLVPAKVGVFGGNVGPTAPPFAAKVDWFVNTPDSSAQPAINVWYGPIQTFGSHGQPQRWVNVVGDVADPSGISHLVYTVNGGPAQALSLGANRGRLANPGDFNAEIDPGELRPGVNTVMLTATNDAGIEASRSVTVKWVASKSWPLPYIVQWGPPGGSPNGVAQVADGHWVIQRDGTVRNLDIGYDRLITIGQASSWRQYDVTARVTINSMAPEGSAVGIVAGFSGATADEHGVPMPDQPQVGHPYPAAFIYSNDRAQPAKVRIYANTDVHPEQTLVADKTGTQLTWGVPYTFKVSVSDNARGGSRFRVKVWKTGTVEPTTWLLQTDGDRSRGSIALVAHGSDVSFGTVAITPR
jgi:hypothetical protein